jgi:hypothetical protein
MCAQQLSRAEKMMETELKFNGINHRVLAEPDNVGFSFFVEKEGEAHPIYDEHGLELWQVSERLRKIGVSEKCIAAFEAEFSQHDPNLKDK